MFRTTIRFDPHIEKKIRILQAKFMVDMNKNFSFHDTVMIVLDKALKEERNYYV